jgi:hypothetical protein
MLNDFLAFISIEEKTPIFIRIKIVIQAATFAVECAYLPHFTNSFGSGRLFSVSVLLAPAGDCVLVL